MNHKIAVRKGGKEESGIGWYVLALLALVRQMEEGAGQSAHRRGREAKPGGTASQEVADD